MAHSEVIQLKSLLNTRDLGGIPGAFGKKVRSKKIIRSGELDKADLDDLRKLYKEEDLRYVIDLRNATEAKQKPDKIIEGLTYLSNPILTEKQMGMTHEEETDAETSEYVFVSRLIREGTSISFMKGLYINFITDEYCLAQYKKLIDLFAADHEGAMLYHCSVGKDRVGMASFFLLKILGAKDDDIIEDFMLTNDCIEPDIARRIARLSKKIDSPVLEETFRSLFQVRKEYITTVFEAIEQEYGGFDSFMKKGLKVEEKEKELLRQKYLA